MSASVLQPYCPVKRPRDEYELSPIKRRNEKGFSYSRLCTPTKDPILTGLSSCASSNIFTSAKKALCQITPLSSLSKKRKCSFAYCGPPTSPLSQKGSLESEFSDSNLQKLPRSTPSLGSKLSNNHPTAHPIFEIPEVLELILRFLDDSSSVPQEQPCQRRKPQSLSHAMLMYHGDQEKALKVWKETAALIRSEELGITPSTKKSGNLHSCLLVNKIWYSVAQHIMMERVYFDDASKFKKFVAFSQNAEYNTKPSLIVLHKLPQLRQNEVDTIASKLASENLKWLELYVCSSIVPSPLFFEKSINLEKLVLPGNKLLTDGLLIGISPKLKMLRELDLRACDKVSDGGIVSIATNCPKLTVCNLGRHRNGHLITSVSLFALASHTNIQTVGMAGCAITDAGLWELALLRGPYITRLSLNNCVLLTNHSMPALLSTNSFPNLSVLEIRNTPQISDVRPIVSYKRWKHSRGVAVLVEGCKT